MTHKTYYSLVFMFSEQDEVALIVKNRPEHLAGKLNGIGGKAEGDEPPIQTAIREVREEANVALKELELRCCVTFERPNYVINVWGARLTRSQWASIRTMTDEEVVKVPYTSLFENGLGLKLDWHSLIFLQAAYIDLRRREDLLSHINWYTISA